MPRSLSDYEGYCGDANNESTHTPKRQRACIEFSKLNPKSHPMNITLDRDFARIYCGKYLLCVKDIVFRVRRVHRGGGGGCGGGGTGAAILSDVDAVIEDDDMLQTFTEIEEKIRDTFENDSCIKHRFPDLEGRVLLNRISTNKVIVTRLRFLDSKPASVSQELIGMMRDDRMKASIALMGIKHVRGDVFPVWRVINGAIKAEPEDVEISPEDEWPGDIVNGDEEEQEEREHDECDNVTNKNEGDVDTQVDDHKGNDDNTCNTHDNNYDDDDDDDGVHSGHPRSLSDPHSHMNVPPHPLPSPPSPPPPNEQAQRIVEIASNYVDDVPSRGSSKSTKSKVKLHSRDRDLIISSLRSDLLRDIETRFSQMPWSERSGGGDHLQNKMDS